MSGTVPPIPPPLGSNTGKPTSLNRADPILVDITNNTSTTNAAQNDNDSDVEEDTKSSIGFLADLNAEFHDKALLVNQKRYYKRSGRDEEIVSFEDEGVTKVKAFMTIAEEEPSVGKNDAISGQKIENLNEVRVKEPRSDNGTKFKNYKLEEFCERKNITLIEAARTMLNSENLPKQFWGDDVNTTCYTQNRSIIVKRHRKTAYDVFRGISPDISYFHVFSCLVHIHNHRDHLGKFDAKVDDGLFLGYSLVAKAFRVFNIRRQEIEETYHVTFSEDDEAIFKSSTEGDEINFKENRSFPDDEFLVPRNKDLNSPDEQPEFTIVDDHHVLNEHDDSESVEDLGIAEDQVSTIIEHVSNVKPSPTIISPSVEVFINPSVPQDRWSREKHIELVNILGEPQAGVTTRSRIKDFEAASAHECLYINFLSEIEPKKLIEALEEEGWIIAMQEELNQFERNKVWTLVPIPHGKTIIGTKWIWKNKMDEHGVVVKNKARLVAQGPEAIRIFLAYAAYMGFMVFQMDVKSAFLNGKILKEVYVQQPPGFESSEFPNHVCKLDKALYGLKQAPRAWYETLSKFLLQHKFVRGTIDNTIFTYKTKSDVIIVQIYVDDIIFGSTSVKLSKQFAKLMTKNYEMSMMGELTYVLGFQIKQDFKGISICQKKYVKDLLKKYDLADSASMKCPMLLPNNLGPDESGVSVNETLFRGMIGSLMYLTASRLDIQFSTCLCARYQANLKESHIVAVKRIFRVLKGTPNLGLWYPKGPGFNLKAYSDSDYVGCNLDRKSTSGGCQTLGEKLVCWSAKKKISVTMSPTEAKYVAAARCSAQVLWIKCQLADYDVLYDKVSLH
ncbi:retrovirus-related pol polyprotein from transposon TNT 1-94 [Tanacetum coccineum]